MMVQPGRVIVIRCLEALVAAFLLAQGVISFPTLSLSGNTTAELNVTVPGTDFDSLITQIIPLVRIIYPDWRISQVRADSNRGASYNSGNYVRLVVCGWAPSINKVVITSNEASNPRTWKQLDEIEPTEDLKIVWSWSFRRTTLNQAFNLLERAHVVIPIHRVWMVKWPQKPSWGPEDQPYYVFESATIPPEQVFVGAHDRKVYKVPDAGLNSNTTMPLTDDTTSSTNIATL